MNWRYTLDLASVWPQTDEAIALADPCKIADEIAKIIEAHVLYTNIDSVFVGGSDARSHHDVLVRIIASFRRVKDCKPRLPMHLDELTDSDAQLDELDECMKMLYDWADVSAVWVNTIAGEEQPS